MNVLRSLAFWAALPFLIPQALRLRKNAPRYKPAAGPTAGRCGDGESRRLLGIGDSIIAGVGASTLQTALVGRTAEALAMNGDEAIEWQALGESGFTCERVLETLVPKLPSEPVDFIIISVGVNDITGLTRVGAWRRSVNTLLDRLQAHSPSATIALAGMPPMAEFPLLPQPLRAVIGLRARIYDREAARICAQRKAVRHVPLEFETEPGQFAGDGYHPSEASYVEFGEVMAAALLD